MKKSIWCLMLITSITGTAFAQSTASATDKIFDLPSNYPQRRFHFDLGKGNKMQIELASVEDLSRFSNIDSLIHIFLADIGPLKDSLGDEIFSRRIDYVIESINTFGASNRPGSPHYKDQMSMFLNQQTKPMTLDKQEVLRKAKRVYHPGE